MHFTRFGFITIVISLFLFPACGPQYQRRQLSELNDSNSIQQVTSHDVTIAAHHMTRAEIHKTFGTRGRKLGYYGLCPIHLTIKNNSNSAMIFDPSQVTLPYANHADVAYCLQNHTIRNTACFVGLGLLATSIACIYTLPFAAWYYLTGVTTAGLYIGLSTATGMLILTPTVSVYYAKQARNANRAIAQDLKDVAVTHTHTIPAGQELNVILFTKKENCKKDFAVSLINEATQEITTFNIIH